MIWFMLNIPPSRPFFAAWAGIPLWMTVKHPGTGPAFSAAPACPGAAAQLAEDKQPAPALAAWPILRTRAGDAHSCWSWGRYQLRMMNRRAARYSAVPLIASN
jgi:hypothetical protein